MLNYYPPLRFVSQNSIAIPFFSILLPTYNRAHTLPRSIHSLQQQIFTNWECILIDDASTDNSATIIKQYQKEDYRFHVLTNNCNLGVGASLHRAAQAARGKWLARLDSDDAYDPEYLQNRYQYLQQHPEAQVLYGGLYSEDEYVTDCLDPTKKLHIHETSQGATIVIARQEYLDMEGYSDLRYGEDYDLMQKLKRAQKKILRVNFQDYHYCRAEIDSLTRQQNR